MSQISLSSFANFSSAVPWGLWAALYIWLIGISAGSFFLAAAGNLAGNAQLKKITRLAAALSLAALLPGLLSIQIDLGHIERFYKLFTSPQLFSPMAWMAWLYTLYLLILAASFRWVGTAIPRPFLFMAAIFSLAVIVVEGFLFAAPPGKHWHSPIFLLHFITCSLVSGIAALIFVAAMTTPREEKRGVLIGLGNIALPMILINLAVEAAAIVLSHNINHIESWVLLSTNVLAIALLIRHNPVAIAIAGCMELADVFLAKYNSLISAQIVEPFKGFGRAYVEPRLIFDYKPSGFEWLATVLIILASAALFYILHRISSLTMGRAK